MDHQPARASLQQAICILLALFFATLPAGAQEKQPWWQYPLGFDPAIPFNAEKMDRLVDAVADSDTENARPLVDAIMQVTAQKDTRFKDLIGRKDLRKRKTVDQALYAYDFAINGNKKALDRLITADAAQKLGGDYMTIAIMGMIDEWDRTIEAVWRHKAHSDGTAGETASQFLEAKRSLFPESCAKFRKSISTEQKVLERLASTVADDPKMNHDHGSFYQYYGWENHRNPHYKKSVGFCVKELPRKGAEPLIFVTMGKRKAILEPVREKKGSERTWKEVTDQVLPDKKYRTMRLRAHRRDNVIETGLYEAPYSRQEDLMWQDGKFIVREQDGEKWTGSSREPYTPSR